MRVDMDTKKVVPTNGYATAVSPIDGTVWLSVPEVNGPQNKLFMLDPKTGKYKDFLLPLPGRLSHGIDFSTDGTVWFSAGSGHLGHLDPKTGKFKYWDLPGPKFTGTGMETGSTEYPYFLWVDQFDYVWTGQGHGDRYRNHFGFHAHLRSEKGNVLRVPHGLSDAVLHARPRWPNRRCQGRLEGPRNLGDLQFVPAQIHGDSFRLGQSHSNSPKSIGELTGNELNRRGEWIRMACNSPSPSAAVFI